MIRIFVTGDNHIGLKYASHEQAAVLSSRRITAFENMVESANKENCAPDALQAVLDEIAECNDCSVEEITDEMFNEHVTPEADDVISSSTYSYSKKTGKSISTYETIMESSQKETNEK